MGPSRAFSAPVQLPGGGEADDVVGFSPGSESEFPAEGSQKLDGMNTLFFVTEEKKKVCTNAHGNPICHAGNPRSPLLKQPKETELPS